MGNSMPRPYLRSSILELKNLALCEDPYVLDAVHHELEFRSTQQARNLLVALERKLAPQDDAAGESLGNRPNGKGGFVKPNAASSKARVDSSGPAARLGPRDRRAIYTRDQIEKLRQRLLDLTKRNRLLNYVFSETARGQVRVIDELPNQLFERLQNGGQMWFRSLKEPEDEPNDERTLKFTTALNAARIEDADYIESLKQLGDEDLEDPKFRRLERELRDRVRKSLGLPVRPSRQTLSRAEIARYQGLDPSYEMPLPTASTGAPAPGKHSDNEIQTPLFPDEMERKLSALRDNTRKGLEEMGINTLFAAYGFLEWYEADQSDERLFAPLMLQPLELNRETKKGAYRYGVTGIGEEAQINLTLVERLKEFAMALPSLDDEDTPERYFTKVAQAIKEKRRWRVHRYIVVGTFSFGKLAMWHDLDPDRWPEDCEPATHSVVAGLLAGTGQGIATDAEDYPVDKVDFESRLPLTIMGADTSQLSAIIDAIEGKNLAIKGPPGTGKSQTITNLIAAALDKGKTVLFVAEKMAALDVVKKRLDYAGLGEFVLELHSTKARKKDLLAAVAERLELGREVPPGRIAETRDTIKRIKSDLTSYANLINSGIGACGKTIQEVLWAESRTRDIDLPRKLEDVRLDNAPAMNSEDIRRCRDRMNVLERCWHAAAEDLGGVAAHPWRGVQKALLPFDQQPLLDDVADWRNSLADVQKLADQVCDILGTHAAFSLESLADLLRCVKRLPQVDAPIVKDRRHKLIAALADKNRHEQSIALDQAWLRRDALKRTLVDTFVSPEAVIQNPKLLRHAAIVVSALEDRSVNAGDIGRKLKDADSQRVTWLTIHKAINEIGALANLGEVESHTDVELIRAAGEILQNTPRAALECRRAALADNDADSILTKAESQAAHLIKVGEEVTREIRVDTSLDPTELRTHAIVMEETNLVARLFSGKYKQARAVYFRLSGNRSRPKLAASRILQLADLLDQMRAFSQDAQARTALGPTFVGVETEFGHLRSAHKYCRKAREFGREPGIGSKLRTFLMGNTIDDVRALGDRISNDVHMVEQASRVLTMRADATLKQVSADVEAEATNWKSMKEVSDEMGLKSGVTLDQIPALAEIADQYRAIEEELARHLKSLAALIEPLGFSQADPRARSDALQLAEMISPPLTITWINPTKWRKALFSANLEERLIALHSLSGKVVRACNECERLGTRVEARAELDVALALGGPTLQSASISAAQKWASAAMASSDALARWTNWLHARADAESEGLVAIVSILEEAERMEHLTVAFDRVFWRSLARKAFADHPQLERFSGMAQENVRTRFKELDAKLMDLNRRQLRSDLLDRSAPPGSSYGKRSEWTDMALLQAQSQLQRPRMPIRDLMSGGHNALQIVKPCWMMSPGSIAQFLPAGQIEFDLVVIDEASQMRPEESIGAAARGRQIVVVGDNNQLPPTSFFDRAYNADEDDDEDVDAESILDLALSVFHPARNLNWHYRSQHESLISFSNKEFYGGKLVVFPSPLPASDELGVKYRRVDGLYSGRVNHKEALAVANAAVAHMRSGSRLSLGVVAVNRGQAELLLAEIERLVLQDEDAQAYIAHWEGKLESFFVKNLETVQGDERDVIMISTVYGPNAQGVVHQRFGPINSNVGHRRLNVLFTRAKHRLELFTSLTAESIRPTDQSSLGVLALKRYLEYAGTGRIETGDAGGGEPDSDFECFVSDALRQHGFEVRTQVGVAGFHIDLGIRHTSYPHGYILGVECDGAAYHTAKSARDRDALRQAILEGLGWKLYRIWSTDWFKDPPGETQKLLRVLSAELNAVKTSRA